MKEHFAINLPKNLYYLEFVVSLPKLQVHSFEFMVFQLRIRSCLLYNLRNRSTIELAGFIVAFIVATVARTTTIVG